MHPTLKEIAQIRATNNDLWMKILDIALRSNPEETKLVLAQIKRKDAEVTNLVGVLIDGEYGC